LPVCWSCCHLLLFLCPSLTSTHPLSLHDALPICIAQRILLIQESRIRSRLYIIPGTPFVHDQSDALSRVITVHDRCMVLDQSFQDRKSTRLNSSHVKTSYAVFCLKKKRIQHVSIV